MLLEKIQKIKNMCNNMFFWCGIQLFYFAKPEYGGYNHFLCYKILKGKYTQIIISLTYKLGFHLKYKEPVGYYDGVNYFYIKLLFIRISWGK